MEGIKKLEEWWAMFSYLLNEKKEGKEKIWYKRSGKRRVKYLGPYTLEHTRPRLAHGSQASDGLVSTGEGDHSGILSVLKAYSFFLFSF